MYNKNLIIVTPGPTPGRLEPMQRAGWGLGKQQAQNQRIAQWKVRGKAFEGGVYESVFAASNFQEYTSASEMVTWTCLCAIHGTEAMLAVCIGSVCVCLWMRYRLCLYVCTTCVRFFLSGC